MAPSRDSARVAPGPQRIIDGDEGFSTIPYCRNSIGRTSLAEHPQVSFPSIRDHVWVPTGITDTIPPGVRRCHHPTHRESRRGRAVPRTPLLNVRQP